MSAMQMQAKGRWTWLLVAAFVLLGMGSAIWAISSAAYARATVTVPAGTHLALQLTQFVASDKSRPGEEIAFRTVEAVLIEDRLVVPKDTVVRGRVVRAEPAERPQRAGRLVLAVDEMDVRGRTVPIQAEFAGQGRPSHEEDAGDIAAGAAIGAIAGALIKGVPGALAGIVIGGGGVFLATRGEDVELPSGTRLAITLRAPADIPVD